jgi:predicted Zn-dependent protease
MLYQPPPASSSTGSGVDQVGRDGFLVQIDCIAYLDCPESRRINDSLFGGILLSSQHF